MVLAGCDRADTSEPKGSLTARLSQFRGNEAALLAQLAEEGESEMAFERALGLYSEISDLQGIDLLKLIVLENIDNWIGEKAFALLADTDLGQDPSDRGKLRRFYRSYVEAAPDSQLAVEAVRRLVSLASVDEELAVIRGIKESHRGALPFYAALVLEGDLLIERGNVPGALNAYLQVCLECERFADTARLRGRVARAFEQAGMRWEATVFRATPQTSFASSEVAQFYWDSLAWLRQEKDSETDNWRALWDASDDSEALLDLRVECQGSPFAACASLFRISVLLTERIPSAVVEEADVFVCECGGILCRGETARASVADRAYYAARILTEKLIWHLSQLAQGPTWNTAAMRESAVGVAGLAVQICEAHASSDETWRERLAESVMARGRLWEALGAYGEAIAEYRRAMEMSEGELATCEAQMRIAGILAERWGAHYQAGKACAEFCSKLGAGGVGRQRVRYAGGKHYFCAGAYDEAIGQFTEVISEQGGDGTSAAAEFMIALCHLQKGDYTAAIKSLRGFVARYPDSNFSSRALYLAGVCHLSGHHYEDARRCFRELKEYYPESEYAVRAPDYLRRLADLQAAARERQQDAE